MLKEAIEKIREMAINEAKIQTVTIDGYVYAKNKDGEVNRLCEEDTQPIVPQTIAVTSLSGLVQWVKNECKKNSALLFVEVQSPDGVIVRTERSAVRKEETSKLFSLCISNNTFRKGFRSYEEAMIELRSKYQHTEDIDYLLKMLSSMKIEDSVQTDDNGLTQQVTVKKGIALTENVTIKPIVKLKPYRTFLEVEQPESEFLVRIGEKGQIGFFEADGGMWQITARNIIADYLKDALKEEIDKERIKVIL